MLLCHMVFILPTISAECNGVGAEFDLLDSSFSSWELIIFGFAGNLVNVVIPRPGPNGEPAPGVGKVSRDCIGSKLFVYT